MVRSYLLHLLVLVTIPGVMSHTSTSATNLPVEVHRVVRLEVVEVGGGSVLSLVATAVLCFVEDTFLLRLYLNLDDVEWQKQP